MCAGGASATIVRVLTLLSLLLYLSLGSFSTTSAQSDDNPPTVTAGAYDLAVLRAWQTTRSGDAEPALDRFLVLETQLNNTSSEEYCFSTGDFLAQANGLELQPDAMRAIRDEYFPGTAYPDNLSGQCVAGRSSAPSLLVYDVPAELSDFALSFTPGDSLGTVSMNFASADDSGLAVAAEGSRPVLQALRLVPLASAWYMTGAQIANVRACASVTCQILGIVKYGYVLAVNSTVNGWHEIQLAEGRVGYIAAHLTIRSVPTEEWYITGAQRVNVRACGAANCRVVATLAYGDSIAVASTEDGWHAIQFPNGRMGYVASHLTSRTMAPGDGSSSE